MDSQYAIWDDALCSLIAQDNIKSIFYQRGKPYPVDLSGVQNLLKITSYTAVVSVLWAIYVRVYMVVHLLTVVTETHVPANHQFHLGIYLAFYYTFLDIFFLRDIIKIIGALNFRFMNPEMSWMWDGFFLISCCLISEGWRGMVSCFFSFDLTGNSNLGGLAAGNKLQLLAKFWVLSGFLLSSFVYSTSRLVCHFMPTKKHIFLFYYGF